MSINLGEPRFMLVERAYDLQQSLNYPSVVEELADWLITLRRVLESEPSHKVFPLVAILAFLGVEYSHETTLPREQETTLTSELFSAFVILHTGDPSEARAAFVLALVRATKHMT